MGLSPYKLKIVYDLFLKGGLKLLIIDRIKCKTYKRKSRYQCIEKHTIAPLNKNDVGKFCRQYGIFYRVIGVFK